MSENKKQCWMSETKEYIVGENSYAYEMGRYEELKELIRCRDCKYYPYNPFAYADCPPVFSFYPQCISMKPDGFCSLAEKIHEEKPLP